MSISILTSFDNIALKLPWFTPTPKIKSASRSFSYNADTNAYDYITKIVIGFVHNIGYVDEVYYEVFENGLKVATVTTKEDTEIIYRTREEYNKTFRSYIINGYIRVSLFKQIFLNIRTSVSLNRPSELNISSKKNIVTDMYPNVFSPGEWIIDGTTEEYTGIKEVNNEPVIFFRLYSAITHNGTRVNGKMSASILPDSQNDNSFTLFNTLEFTNDSDIYYDIELTSSSYDSQEWVDCFNTIVENKYLDIIFIVEYTNNDNTKENYNVTKRVYLQ